MAACLRDAYRRRQAIRTERHRRLRRAPLRLRPSRHRRSNHAAGTDRAGHGSIGQSGNQVASDALGLSRGGRGCAAYPKVPAGSASRRWTWAAKPAAVQLIDLLRETQPVAVIHLAFVLDPLRSGRSRSRAHVADQRGRHGAHHGSHQRGQSHRRPHPTVHLSQQRFRLWAGNPRPGQGRRSASRPHSALRHSQARERRSRALSRRKPGRLPRPTSCVRTSSPAPACRTTWWGRCAERRWARASAPPACAPRANGLPFMLPRGEQYLEKRFSSCTWTTWRACSLPSGPPGQRSAVTILNVAGRGEPLTFQRCAEIAQTPIKRVPTAPPSAPCCGCFGSWGSLHPARRLPYMIGSYTMDTSRLQQFLGAEYPQVIQYTIRKL